MKQILVMMAAVVLMGCEKKESQASIFEKAARKSLNNLENERELTDKWLARIDSLELADTQITDAGLKDLVKLQKLNFLVLTNTQITDAGLEELAKMKQLEWLEMYDTQITEAGAAEFKKALPNCSILAPNGWSRRRY